MSASLSVRSPGFPAISATDLLLQLLHFSYNLHVFFTTGALSKPDQALRASLKTSTSPR